MNPEPQESKFESLKVKTEAKERLGEVMVAIQKKRGPHAEMPSFTETVLTIADHFLATAT